MGQYSKVKIINLLQSKGVTTWLYKLGLANSKMLSYANAYNHMHAQIVTGHTRSEAIKLTAAKFRFTRRSMYNVLKEMETSVEVPAIVEKLLSTN